MKSLFGGTKGDALLGASRNGGQPNSESLGAATGAPMRTEFSAYLVPPTSILNNGNSEPVLVVSPTRPTKLVTFTAPSVGFSIYIGGAGVRGSGTGGMPLPAGIPYAVTVPGNQPIYAVTDAPTYLRLSVQIAPLLSGDRERQMG